MAFDKANAEETPFPAPDISSPKSSLPNLSLIKSVSEDFYDIDDNLSKASIEMQVM